MDDNFLTAHILLISLWLAIFCSTYQHVVDKFFSFCEDKLRLLQSTGFQRFANQLSSADEVLFNVKILEELKSRMLKDATQTT